MKCRILFLILLATALNGQDYALRWAVAGQAADWGSTQMLLANGATELNPLMVQQPLFAATKVGLSVVFYVYARRHPADKRTMRIFAVLSWLPAGYNLIQLMK